MLTSLYFNSVGGAEYELNNDIAPMNLFDPQVAQRVVTDRDKMQAHGTWPTFSYRGGMEIHCEGALLADDSGDYNTKRLALVTALFGDPDDAVTERKLGDLVPTFDDQDEAWTTEVTINAFSAPLTGASPGYTLYLVTFFSWTPYFTGVDSNNKYYYS